jgi:hypothetical protein
MSSVIKARAGSTFKAVNVFDREQMRHYGYIYADGSYSDEREPRGAILVPRRPSPAHFWDPDSREWYTDGAVMPASTGRETESVDGDPAGKAPTLAELEAQMKQAAAAGQVNLDALSLPGASGAGRN